MNTGVRTVPREVTISPVRAALRVSLQSTLNSMAVPCRADKSPRPTIARPAAAFVNNYPAGSVIAVPRAVSNETHLMELEIGEPPVQIKAVCSRGQPSGPGRPRWRCSA
jgi:hypothetical protein